jgi:hypothetical protein
MIIRQPRRWTREELESLRGYILERMSRWENAFAGMNEEGVWAYIPWSTRHFLAVEIAMM